MSKVTEKCPICNGKFIVVMLHEGTNTAWPECFKCGFSGHTKEDKEAMEIDLELNSHMDETQIFKEAVNSWEEYISLLNDPNFSNEREDN